MQTTKTQQRPTTAWEMWFTPYERSVALARAQVARTLTHWGYTSGGVDSVTLVVSELVTNAVVHGGGRQPIHVQLTAETGGCLIEVSDASAQKPMAATPGPDDEHGRGLLLVKALADSWGTHVHEDEGKTVWARLSRDQPAELPSGEGEQTC
ncbi:ATP-binding protein [Peterkaempfera bronchialis]|uniref:ATP-binding protein n=1 Tax=Peterkaempfera bronchialis TaxID=2126346 RepID=UPI003C2CED9C